MTKTSWLQFTQVPSAVTVKVVLPISGDLAGLQMGDDATVLKVFGELEIFTDASVGAVDSLCMFGLTVQDENLTAAQTPTLLAAAPVEDNDGFWLEKHSVAVLDVDVEDRYRKLLWDTSSKRVMRGEEKLTLVIEPSTNLTAASFFIAGWFRILVLSG